MDNKGKILLYLAKHLFETHTMLEISKAAKIPYATFYRTVQQIPDLITKDQRGNTIILGLQIKNPAVPSYLSVASYEEKQEYLSKQAIIKKIETELQTDDILLLFGSYPSGKQTEKSDVDLLIANKDGRKSMSFSKYELLFKVKINAIFLTFKELREMLKDRGENVGNQALKNHIVLNNPLRFWGLVLHGIR